MENVEELRREADAVKERIKKDILELRGIIQKAAVKISESGQTEISAAARRAEQNIDETIARVEENFSKAIGLIAGSGQKAEDFVSRDFNYTDFINIEAGCAFRVETVQSRRHLINVRAAKDLIDDVIVVKSGNTLKLSLRQHIFQSRPSVEVKIEMPLINKIRLGAATRCTLHGFKTSENMDIRLTGNSVLDTDITAGNLRCEISGASRLTGKMFLVYADIILSGASRIELEGSARNVDLNAWGASDARTEHFHADNMKVQMNGASEGIVNVSNNLNINLDSGSRLTYLNNPTIHNIMVSGASSLSHK